MPPSLICYHASLASGVRLRAYLNDLPIFKEGMHHGPDTRQGPCNHLMVPGENTLSLEVLRAPRPRSTGAPPGESIHFAVFTAADPVNAPKDVTMFHEVRYSIDVLARRPEAEESPHHYTARFDVPVPVASPLYLSSPVRAVDCKGTPELHHLVGELHAAIAAGDLNRFFVLTELRMEEHARALEGYGGTVAEQRESARRFFAGGPVVEPFDPSELHFEARAFGRVVVVTRADGRAAIEINTKDDRTYFLRANLWLAMVDGIWRIVG